MCKGTNSIKKLKYKFVFKLYLKKKSFQIYEKTFVGVAGFEPAASCSQSRRDNRATLHPESGCKYKTIFGFTNVYFEIVIYYLRIIKTDVFFILNF